MSHIAEKCGCTFYALPQDLTMRSADSLANMFKPIPYNKVDFTDDTSTFAIVYKTKYSEHLDNGDGYKDDGYDIADSLGNINPILPESFTESNKPGEETVKIPLALHSEREIRVTLLELIFSHLRVLSLSLNTR